MSYRPYAPPSPLLFGYDPVRDLPADHLARWVEAVVERAVQPPAKPPGKGNPAFDPRLCLKVLVYGYATGVRSSRVLERLCEENLAYLFLTRGDTPSYRTLCTARTECQEQIEAVWLTLLEMAAAQGRPRVGRIVLDSTKIRANASPEAVVTQKEFAALRQELAQILEEAAAIDAQEEAEGRPSVTRMGDGVKGDQMRDILRRVRQRLAQARRAGAGEPPESEAAEGGAAPAAGEAPLRISARMRQQVTAAHRALEEAQAQGQAYLCLTDPDAQMMGEGREKKIRECHSFEIAVDNGLIVAGQRGPDATDNDRLEPLVQAAQAQEPTDLTAVTADSGYYAGDPVAGLILAGIDPCIPDSNTAGDLHRGQPIGTIRSRSQGQVPLVYDPQTDRFGCPEGNVLVPVGRKQDAGQWVTEYRAQRSCQGCPLARQCLRWPQAQHRTLKIGQHHALLEAARQRFAHPDHVARYHHRGAAVETVFGFLRGALGFGRWLLRGERKVGVEASLFKVAYQLRKGHRQGVPAR